jgi:hypothetical protein
VHETRDASAEGVLVALRRCSIDDAFIDIVLAAKRHNVAPLGLAGALVTIAQNDSTRGLDDNVVAAARHTWGTLLDGHAYNRVPDRRAPGTAWACDDQEHDKSLPQKQRERV